MPSSHAHDLPPIVFDTNALISAAILPDSISKQCLDFAVEHFRLVVTQQTWDEFRTRIERKKLLHYFDNEHHRNVVVAAINRVVDHVVSNSVVTDCSDADDNKFLALAFDTGAKCIVAGDGDLLALNPWRGIEIIAPGNFYRKHSAK